MLRITEQLENANAVRVRLDGKISAECYPDLAEVFARHHGPDRRIIVLDMAGVTYLHCEAAQKLVKVRGDRLRIVNCSPFISALLDTVAKRL